MATGEAQGAHSKTRESKTATGTRAMHRNACAHTTLTNHARTGPRIQNQKEHPLQRNICKNHVRLPVHLAPTAGEQGRGKCKSGNSTIHRATSSGPRLEGLQAQDIHPSS